MRLVDFLILLLEAHAETLKRLAALFGEDRLLEILESSGEDEAPTPSLAGKLVPFAVIGTKMPAGARSPYVELEGFVRELHLPEFLEFHLWAYPHYRAFIESDLDLGSDLQAQSDAECARLIDEAVSEAKQWVHKLQIPPQASAQAETAAGVPWLRFRSQAFRKMGLRPMGPVA